MKVLLVGEASGVHRNLKKGLAAHGVEATLVTQSASTSWKWYDDTFAPDWPGVWGGLARNIAPFAKILTLRHYDVINFVNTITAVHGTHTKYLDLPLFRRKTDVMSYYALGCDEIGLIRRNDALPYAPCASCLGSGEVLGRDCERFFNPVHDRSRERVGRTFDFGAASMVEYSHCADLFRDFRHIPFPVDVDVIGFKPAQVREKTRVIHTPTRRGFKGTDRVLAAIELLKECRSDFEFQVVEGLSYAAFLQATETADVIIDQVYSQSSGMNGYEMLAAGKIVFTGATELGRTFFDDGLINPAFDASPEPQILAKALSDVLNRKADFPALAAAGREFVSTRHDPARVAGQFLGGWANAKALRNGARSGARVASGALPQ